MYIYIYTPWKVAGAAAQLPLVLVYHWPPYKSPPCGSGHHHLPSLRCNVVTCHQNLITLMIRIKIWKWDPLGRNPKHPDRIDKFTLHGISCQSHMNSFTGCLYIHLYLAPICSSILKVQPLQLEAIQLQGWLQQHPQCILNRMQQHWKITKVKTTKFLLIFISIIGI